MARDQTPQLRAKVVRARATKDRTEQAAGKAQKAYRVALMKARDGGVAQADLARDVGSDPSRIRQLIKQARAEADFRKQPTDA
jgi:DNA-directed RNA polymerase specialized sigma24 family protein